MKTFTTAARLVVAASAVSTAVLTSSAVAASGAPATVPTTKLTLTDKAISGLPKTIPAGWHTFTVGQSAKDARQVTLGKLAAGYTFADVKADTAASNGQSAAALKALFRIVTKVSLKGGSQAGKAGVTDGTFTSYLTPGDYVAADLAVDDGPSLVREFTVTAGKSAPTPKTTATVQLSDFKIKTSGLKPGTQSVAFRAAGGQTHEFIVVQYDDKHTRADVLKALQGDSQPSWLKDKGVVGFVSPNQSFVSQLTFAKGGHYLFVCFLPDTSMPGMYTFYDA